MYNACTLMRLSAMQVYLIKWTAESGQKVSLLRLLAERPLWNRPKKYTLELWSYHSASLELLLSRQKWA